MSNQVEAAIKVSDADNLKPFPAVVLKLVEESRAETPDTNQMIEWIECDPAISTKVLSVANSPLYGCTREIDSVPRAILVLGARAISSLAVSITTKNVFDSDKASTVRQTLLEHSLGAAVVARILAANDVSCDPNTAFLVGIMHDIGKLVFLDRAPNEYESNFEEFRKNSIQNEDQMFGINHVDIGFRYVTNLGLPNDINLAVANHHQPDPTPKNLNGIANIADQLSKIWGLGMELNEADRNELAGRCSFDCNDFSIHEAEAKEIFESIRCVFQ